MKDEKGDSVNFLNAEQDKNIIVIVLKTNLFVRFLEESEDTKESFRNCGPKRIFNSTGRIFLLVPFYSICKKIVLKTFCQTIIDKIIW